jgi:hypothetical protein
VSHRSAAKGPKKERLNAKDTKATNLQPDVESAKFKFDIQNVITFVYFAHFVVRYQRRSGDSS